jgi:DNA-binding NarL/FixJ family response regulator
VADVVIASDESWVREEVRSVLSGRADVQVREVGGGLEVIAAAQSRKPDLVVLDLQMGNMGGVATCLELRLDESAGRLGHVAVLMLLDRRADVFLARRGQADGYVVKPLDPIRLRRAVNALLEGGRYEDVSFAPVGVGVGTGAGSVGAGSAGAGSAGAGSAAAPSPSPS